MKDELKIIPLGDAVAKMKTGSTPPTSHAGYFGGDIPWFTPGDIGSTKNLVESTRTLTQEAISEGEAKLFEKGMLLVTCIGDIGRVGILQQPSYSNQQITALKFKDDIDSDFAYYWFVSNKKKLVNLANQAIVPILNNERLSEIEFAYPPLTEQKRIASLLTRADRLRQLRRTAHDLGDALLQSVFLEMFGDPTINSKHWGQATIKELGKVVTGSTPPTEAKGMFGGSIPFITPGDLTVDTLKSQRYVTEEGAKKSRVVRAGSTLVCCIGATIGKTDIAKTKCAFNQQINGIEWNENIQDDFGLTMMKFFSRIVAERGISTTLPILKKSEFEEIVIPVPPLSLQEEFAGVVARVESLRGRMGESTRQVEGLFESLLSESFGNQ